MPPSERVAFAELILASIDSEEEIRQAWVKEVKEHISIVNEGKAELLDFETL